VSSFLTAHQHIKGLAFSDLNVLSKSSYAEELKK